MENIQLVNWYSECLAGDNDGLIFGVYYIDNDGNILDVEWYASNAERAKAIVGNSQWTN